MDCPTKKCPVCKQDNPNSSFEDEFIHLNMNGKPLNAIRTIERHGTHIWVTDKKNNWAWTNISRFKTEQEAEQMEEKLKQILEEK
jgi:hypothetical protein